MEGDFTALHLCDAVVGEQEQLSPQSTPIAGPPPPTVTSHERTCSGSASPGGSGWTTVANWAGSPTGDTNTMGCKRRCLLPRMPKLPERNRELRKRWVSQIRTDSRMPTGDQEEILGQSMLQLSQAGHS